MEGSRCDSSVSCSEIDETVTNFDEDEYATETENSNRLPTFDFSEKSWRTDFAVVVEGRKLYVAKNILSLASPVFDTMFQSDFKESSCDELELPGKKLNDFIEFLRCIYPNTFTQITRDTAVKILPLVEEYQVLHLKPRCEAVLLKSVDEETTVEELLRLLDETSLYDLKALRKKCASLASEKPEEEVDEALAKSHLPAEAAKEILEKMNKKLKENIAELQVLVEKKSDECKESTEKLQKINAALTEELALFMQYFSADVKKTKEMKLDGCNWQEKQFILVVDMESSCIKSEKKIIVWDIPLTVMACTGKRSGDEWLKLEIHPAGGKIIRSFKVHLILVNRQPRGQNLTLSFDESLGYLYGFVQKVSMWLKLKSEVMNLTNGFLRDGNIGVIVLMFMSEPNRK